MPSAAKLREAILNRRIKRIDHNIQRGHITNRLPVDMSGRKSSLMLNIEARFNQPIELLIWKYASSRLVANELEVGFKTICRWRNELTKEYINE